MERFELSWYEELLLTLNKIPIKNYLTVERKIKLYNKEWYTINNSSVCLEEYTPKRIKRSNWGHTYKLSLKELTSNDIKLFLYYMESTIIKLSKETLVKIKLSLIFPLDGEEYAKEFKLPSYWVSKKIETNLEQCKTWYINGLGKELLKINVEEYYYSVTEMYFLFTIIYENMSTGARLLSELSRKKIIEYYIKILLTMVSQIIMMYLLLR